jgi:hypothetical protein
LKTEQPGLMASSWALSSVGRWKYFSALLTSSVMKIKWETLPECLRKWVTPFRHHPVASSNLLARRTQSNPTSWVLWFLEPSKAIIYLFASSGIKYL